jgi:hypothetical protein
LDTLKTDLLAAQGDGLLWKFVLVPEPIQNLGVAGGEDRFEGYTAERTELLKFIVDHRIQNVVFITADLHGTIVNNVNYQLGPDQPSLPTDTFEIVTGPVAYAKPFGPTAFDKAESVQTPFQANLLKLLLSAVAVPDRAAFEALPRPDQDRVFRSIMDLQLRAVGLDTIGLDGSTIDATLLDGNYVAAHSYGWTQFEINPTNQQLTMTTYGIKYYSASDIDTSITNQVPEVVNRFTVRPQKEVGPALTVSLVNGAVQIVWFSSSSNYILESADNLVEKTVTWSDTGFTTTVSGNTHTVTIQPTMNARFYRLRKR